MTDYRSMYDRDYIGHWDLGGRDVAVTISKVNAGELTAVGGRKSKKPIVHFRNGPKPLICNKTNAKTIAALYGNMVEDWVGKRITLFVSMTRNPDGGGETECIRIRPKMPGAGQDDAFAEGAQPPLSRRTVAEPIAAPEPIPPSLSPEAPGAATHTTSKECLDILAAIDLAKGKADMTALQQRIGVLQDDDERRECTEAWNFRVAELKKAAKGKGEL